MPELERLIFPLSFPDLLTIYAYALADALHEQLPELPEHLSGLAEVVARYAWRAREEQQQSALRLPESLAWLEAQRALKEREA